MKWAVNELINWDNEDHITNLIQIHGTKDKLIPFPKSVNIHSISGGEHLMIVDRAEEISSIINAEINKAIP